MEKDSVRVSSFDSRESRITLSGVPKDEQEKVEGMTFGQYWMTVRDGKLIFSPTRTPLPNPTEDEELLPFWRRREPGQTSVKKLSFEKMNDFSSPSFHISSLCGYAYTPENYRHNAKLLESYGFKCMRSQRGDNGRYWEHWYLPGTWAAKGMLKSAIEETHKKKYGYKRKQREETKAAMDFLCRNVSFGTLDIVVQKCAMVME